MNPHYFLLYGENALLKDGFQRWIGGFVNFKNYVLVFRSKGTMHSSIYSADTYIEDNN